MAIELHTKSLIQLIICTNVYDYYTIFEIVFIFMIVNDKHEHLN